jgi:hypothetical protein
VRWLTEDIVEMPEYLPSIERVLAHMHQHSAWVRAEDRAKGVVHHACVLFFLIFLLLHVPLVVDRMTRRSTAPGLSWSLSRRGSLILNVALLVPCGLYAQQQLQARRIAPFDGVPGQRDRLLNRIGLEIVAETQRIDALVTEATCARPAPDLDELKQRLRQRAQTLLYLDRVMNLPIASFTLQQYYLSDISVLAGKIEQLRERREADCEQR